LEIRGHRYHVRCWGSEADPLLVLLHGGRDASPTFQFLIDELKGKWRIVAPDWLGHGLTSWAREGYRFTDYIADLHFLIEHYSPNEPVIIVGHSLGSNVAQPYAGTMPGRVKRLVSLDGFGFANESSDYLPQKLQAWIRGMKNPPSERHFNSIDEMAARLQKANPRLERSKAEFLAQNVSREVADGRFAWAFDPKVRAPRAALYRFEEWAACLENIEAPVLAVSTGKHPNRLIDLSEVEYRIGLIPRCSRIHVENVGHNLHHEIPDLVAAKIESFLETGELPPSEILQG